MTALPSVESLPPGTRPTEPGWYVMRSPSTGETLMVDVVEDATYGIMGLIATYVREFELAELPLDGFTFIARIYPDRIGQE